MGMWRRVRFFGDFEMLVHRCGWLSVDPGLLPEVLRAQHISPRETSKGLDNWELALTWWWQVAQNWMYISCFPLLWRSSPYNGEMRQSTEVWCSQARLVDYSHKEGLHVKWTFTLIGGYGGGGASQINVINALGFLFITLNVHLTIRFNKRIGWLTPGRLLSLVIFCRASVVLPWDLPGWLWKAAWHRWLKLPHSIHWSKKLISGISSEVITGTFVRLPLGPYTPPLVISLLLLATELLYMHIIVLNPDGNCCS